MKLLFKQRIFSWLDSYDIFDEAGNTVFVVKGQLSWGHCLKIFDAAGAEVGTVKEKVLTWLPKFDLYLGDSLVGSIKRELTFFKPKYQIDFLGWQVSGDMWQWNYEIADITGQQVAAISKQLWRFSDTYTIDVADPDNALYALMLVLAIDAEKCSRDASRHHF